MVNVENVDNAVVLVDPVDGAIGAAQGAVTTGERPEQRLADPLRVGESPRGERLAQANSSLVSLPGGRQHSTSDDRCPPLALPKDLGSRLDPS